MEAIRMNYLKKAGIAVCAVIVSGTLIGPLAGASASDASIKAVIKSFNSKILVAEGHVVTAIGEYKKSGEAGGVKTAIGKSVSVLSALKSKIAAQSASTPKVKAGKAKFDKGLQSVITAYRHLSTAFGEKKASPAAATAEAKVAIEAVNRGRKQLREAVKLLE
jgi:hypothetical protein